MPRALPSPKILKKRTKEFVRFQSDRFKRVKPNWRKSKGIDSRIRRGFRGARPCPNKGYGSDNRTKYKLPNRFYGFRINNVGDLDVLLMQNRKFAAIVASGVGGKKRKQILERAAQLDVRVVNPEARLKSEEHE
eukprot:TRINITY_DN20_c0_g1_i1.p1 TRINITY_DN20_c0_g1~~TRINITY_DN20_c0_g1_i1.p1  ORF type:complete len:134 (-),score=20.38 TRINITY_DN20_c0_g1_i1:95-496(-)